ncbi:MAG: hypothetical protein ACRDV6_07250 [Acidimicrobiales bacterium]
MKAEVMALAVKAKEVELDSRGRVPLGRFATSSRYRVERREDGEIVLTPVISITERELAVLGNPALVESIKLGIKQMRASEVRHYTPPPIVDDDTLA